ncbi:VOC family protein [Microbacterium sp. KR10-403]|uniref:VOC family protein n=1 Tax=Microbacterium sp. KR10-403 TaxID=3158581 RepID=UPI0032E3BDE8
MRSLNAYISFRGNAREAMNFYRDVLGGTLDVLTFGDFPQMPHDPADDGLIMHSYLRTDDGLVLMASDTPSSMDYAAPAGVSLALNGAAEDDAALRRCWDALADGGTVTMPLDAAMWGGTFGMLTDRFGIAWLFSIDAAGE